MHVYILLCYNGEDPAQSTFFLIIDLITEFISVIDINECVEAALSMNDTPLCDEKKMCQNIPGSYQCVCPLGTQLYKIKDECIAG